MLAAKEGFFVGDTAVKPSRILKPGDIVEVKKPPVLYRFKCWRSLLRAFRPSWYLNTSKI
jgi:uncharacterized membrane protein